MRDAWIICDRTYYLDLARCHQIIGNKSGRSWALRCAKTAPVRPSLLAARLAWTERARP